MKMLTVRKKKDLSAGSAKEKLTPSSVANALLNKIKDIEGAIEYNGHQIAEVEGRGYIKSLFASSSTDLIRISKSQNQINDLMLEMIQEIITLNVMSYSFLASVLDEFQSSISKGWRDTNGQVIKLSGVGKSFANTASSIFTKILEGSRSTQGAIELNTINIDAIKVSLTEKDRIDAQQSTEIAALKAARDDDEGRIARIASLLAKLANGHRAARTELDDAMVCLAKTELAVRNLRRALLVMAIGGVVVWVPVALKAFGAF